MARYEILVKQPVSGEILELGCHYGYFACLLGKEHKVTAIDLDPEFLRIAGEVARVNNVDINYERVNAKNLPYEDGQFGTGFMCELLEHLDDPMPILNESIRVVEKYLYITTPAKGVMPPASVPAHKQDFALDDVVGLAEKAGLKVTDAFADKIFNYVFTER